MKVDLVVPMVFPEDRKWFERYRRNSIKEGKKFRNNDRTRSWGLERYFFRGLAKFMPWVNNVFVILESESQLPEWITGVNVVYHRDIIPASLLPTYNSQTIEMFLGNIQGLEEHFIYANDDMIACSPMLEDSFFIDGLPVCYCRELYVDSIESVFHHSIRNSMKLAARDTGYVFEHDVLLRDGHSYAPMLLPVVKEMQALYGDEMLASCTMFRKQKNISQYVYTFRQWMTMRCVDGSHVHHYFDETHSVEEMRETLAGGDAGVCCFNDAGNDCRVFAQAVREQLSLMMSDQCKYEK